MRMSETTRRVWTMPLRLGLLSAFGLVVALIGDGAADVVAWLALGAPVAASLRYALLERAGTG